jgi:signal transduction histidine kinase
VEDLLLELKDLYLPGTLRRSTFDLNRMLEEVHALAKEASRGKKIRLSLAAQDKSSFTRGDREKLKQVLLNVVQNSIEAVDEGGEIAIRSSVRGDRIVVTVSDDGPGIRKAFEPKLFTPFFTTKKEGTGLGLCISKRIIDEHKDCTLELTTEEDRGTTVKIRLPLRGPPVRKTRAGRGTQPVPRTGEQG